MSMRKLLQNIKFLAKHDLRKYVQATIDAAINNADLYENLKYEISDSIGKHKIKSVCNIMDSVDILLHSEKSLIRFGDGEIFLMYGQGIPFQTASVELSKRLKHAMSTRSETLMVAIPQALYSSKEGMKPYARNFWRNNGNKFRAMIESCVDFDNNTYYASELTLGFSNQNIPKEIYFSKFREIWNNRDIVIICGKTVFKDTVHNIFDNAKSAEYIYTPSKNAFTDYENIFTQSMKCDKNKLFIAICGPTAKVLCWDLHANGRRALDLGHIAKSYDWYMRGREITSLSDGQNFFAPD